MYHQRTEATEGRPLMEVTMAIAIDTTRGFEVLRGSRILRHFESYEEALAYMRAGRGRWMRYWGKK